MPFSLSFSTMVEKTIKFRFTSLLPCSLLQVFRCIPRQTNHVSVFPPTCSLLRPTHCREEPSPTFHASLLAPPTLGYGCLKVHVQNVGFHSAPAVSRVTWNSSPCGVASIVQPNTFARFVISSHNRRLTLRPIQSVMSPTSETMIGVLWVQLNPFSTTSAGAWGAGVAVGTIARVRNSGLIRSLIVFYVGLCMVMYGLYGLPIKL